MELEGGVPLCKLHGSLNWSFEDGALVMYQDSRAAFRKGGEAAIVPPVTEKTMPEWLVAVWRVAEAYISAADPWVVCGYSLPEYDKALHEFFARAGEQVRRVYLLDPFSLAIADRWRAVAPKASVISLPGIPEALAHNFFGA